MFSMLKKETYKDMITANQAVALAAVRAKPKVIAAYPISPQTTIVEYRVCWENIERTCRM